MCGQNQAFRALDELVIKMATLSCGVPSTAGDPESSLTQVCLSQCGETSQINRTGNRDFFFRKNLKLDGS